ncbi:CotG/ExsB N-terminal domain-containing protein [Bacillus sp. Bwzl_19]
MGHYSHSDIEEAVQSASTEGLKNYLYQEPHSKKSGKKRKSRSQKKSCRSHKRSRSQKKSCRRKKKRTQKKPYRSHKKPSHKKDDYCSKTEYWKDGNVWVVKKSYK